MSYEPLNECEQEFADLTTELDRWLWRLGDEGVPEARSAMRAALSLGAVVEAKSGNTWIEAPDIPPEIPIQQFRLAPPPTNPLRPSQVVEPEPGPGPSEKYAVAPEVPLQITVDGTDLRAGAPAVEREAYALVVDKELYDSSGLEDILFPEPPASPYPPQLGPDGMIDWPGGDTPQPVLGHERVRVQHPSRPGTTTTEAQKIDWTRTGGKFGYVLGDGYVVAGGRPYGIPNGTTMAVFSETAGWDDVEVDDATFEDPNVTYWRLPVAEGANPNRGQGQR